VVVNIPAPPQKCKLKVLTGSRQNRTCVVQHSTPSPGSGKITHALFSTQWNATEMGAGVPWLLVRRQLRAHRLCGSCLDAAATASSSSSSNQSSVSSVVPVKSAARGSTRRQRRGVEQQAAGGGR
jgi:hypothetical protein